jgi:hypothetical protein
MMIMKHKTYYDKYLIKKYVVGIPIYQQFDIPCVYTHLSIKEVVEVANGLHSLSYCEYWTPFVKNSKDYDDWATIEELEDKYPEYLI